MKKIAALTAISSLIFFSCASNGVEPGNLIDSTENDTIIESTSEISEIEQKDKDNPSENSEEAEVSLSEESEEIFVSAEPVSTELYEPEFIPEEEKISEKEIEEDLAVLEEQIEETVNIIEEKQEIPVENEPAVTIKTDEKEPAVTEKKEPAVEKPQTTPVKTEPATVTSNESVSNIKTENETSLDLQKDAALASEAINNNDEPEKPPVPSRTMTIKNNQYLDINYPGTGWVYLGEVERQNLLVFYGRKINGDTTTFTLQSRKSGTAILHFYKNDNLSGKYIDDYVEVSINTESSTDNSHVTTPDYAKIVPPKPQKPQPPVLEETNTETPVAENKTEYKPAKSETQAVKPGEPDLNIQTIIQNANTQKSNEETENNLGYYPPESSTSISETQPVQEKVISGDLLEEARKAYNEKKYPDALTLVRTFLQDASSRFDEGIFLEAQILEATSSVQDIKEAIKDYDTVIRNWPQSKLWKQAKERSIYLKRFYIDIR